MHATFHWVHALDRNIYVLSSLIIIIIIITNNNAEFIQHMCFTCKAGHKKYYRALEDMLSFVCFKFPPAIRQQKGQHALGSLDLSNAFDRVNHALLVNKPVQLNTESTWFGSYLHERTHSVKKYKILSDYISWSFSVLLNVSKKNEVQ